MSEPSIGRIVHYVSYGTPGGEYGKECRAAIITEVGAGDAVGLCVMNPAGLFFNSCQYDGGTPLLGDEGEVLAYRIYPGGTWHWPERSE